MTDENKFLKSSKETVDKQQKTEETTEENKHHDKYPGEYVPGDRKNKIRWIQIVYGMQKCCLGFIIGLCECLLQVDKEWAGGFQGTLFCLVEHDTYEWELELRFNKSANIQASQGVLKNKTNEIFTYHCLNWNCSIGAFKAFSFEFTADGDVKPNNLIGAIFNGKTVDLIRVSDPPLVTFPSKSVNISKSNGSYDYGMVLYASLLFYESQRSGRLPANKRISWRGDSMLTDSGSNGEDLTGGYFTQGGLAKESHYMAGFTTLLAWGVIDYHDAYLKAGQLDYIRDAIRWSTDYLMKAHVSERVFYTSVGDPQTDTWFWSRPESVLSSRISRTTTPENAQSEILGEAAACLAAASIVFRSSDPIYETKLLTHAKQLYSFANETRDQDFPFSPMPLPPMYGDELGWAAIWLYIATNETHYLLDAKRHCDQFELDGYSSFFETDDRELGFVVLMAKSTGEEKYRTSVERKCNRYVREGRKTPKGLCYIHDYKTLPRLGNLAFACLQAADIGINSVEYFNFTKQQIGYILGDSGRSYVVGIGQNYPQRPRDRGSSCAARPPICTREILRNPDPNPYLLVGALVDGPDEKDVFEDDRTNANVPIQLVLRTMLVFNQLLLVYFIMKLN
ncbi:hypothetical protein I4U23_015919 [Adineta vaga]|nr:hypothetical protein I4U23_015919 [Adineta vaga]